MHDPTTVGNCEACGDLEYLVLWHGRHLCMVCATRGPAPSVEPSPVDPDRSEVPTVSLPMSEPRHHSLAWSVVLAVIVAGAGLVAHLQQETEIQVLRQNYVNLERRLDSIERKLDQVLDARAR